MKLIFQFHLFFLLEVSFISGFLIFLIILSLFFVPLLIDLISQSFVGAIFLIVIGVIGGIIWFIEKARVKYNDNDDEEK
jgi:hypothetical protein